MLFCIRSIELYVFKRLKLGNNLVSTAAINMMFYAWRNVLDMLLLMGKIKQFQKEYKQSV